MAAKDTRAEVRLERGAACEYRVKIGSDRFGSAPRILIFNVRDPVGNPPIWPVFEGDCLLDYGRTKEEADTNALNRAYLRARLSAQGRGVHVIADGDLYSRLTEKGS